MTQPVDSKFESKNFSIQDNQSSISARFSPPRLFSRDQLLKFKNAVWPIENHELPKFLSITLLMFCILGIQNLIRAIKDSVIVTMIGAETTSFLKVWGVMPAAFLITIIYVKLVSLMKAEKIFYIILSSFLTFFAIFAFLLFPNYQLIHLSADKSQYLAELYPHLKWFIFLLSNWSFSLFYIIAELWPNAIFALLFWQFVNKITTIDQSKRFYVLFGLFGQTGLIISGIFLSNLKAVDQYFVELFNLSMDLDELSIKIVMSISLILGIVALFSFWFINNRILTSTQVDNLKFKVKKNQMTLKESFKMVASSRYIRLITILLISYGLAINLVEGPWKRMLATTYQNPTDYAVFVGKYLSYTGFVTISLVVIGSNIVRIFGWFTAAIITPIVLASTGIMFFSIANFNFISILMISFFALSDPTTVAIIFGALQNILSKGCKYTLFDSTKEMSYVPLDDDLKTKGKAAADMIGSKLGKSLSALIQSVIFIIIPSANYESLSMYLMIVFIAVSCVWVWGVLELSKEYQVECDKHKGEELIF